MPHALISAAAEQSSTLQTAATVVGIITGGAGVLAGIGWAVRRVAWFIRRIVHFLDDWQGEEARPGQEAKPGLMARVASLEETVTTNSTRILRLSDTAERTTLATAAISSQLGVIVDAVAQLQPNRGSTMRDAIARIEADTAAFVGRLPAHVTTNHGDQ